MFADLVGFTQLSQRNEAKALALLEDYRSVLRPLVGAHRGREVKTIGDGFLFEFGSALEAVRCAFEMQSALRDRNSIHAEDEQVRARIGIHVGDVVRAANDIYGDAVNIASRIEPLAEPGGICVSQPVHIQVANKFELPMISLGAKSLKNVYVPMEVFKVVLPWDGQQDSLPVASPKTRVAILPFSNISPDRNDEYFADGMTEELINTISHNSQLKVIARTTVGRYKDTPKSVREIGKEIGAGTILEGSVRKSGDKIRVTAQLIDAATEDHLWSDNYDRRLDDVFSIQSEIAKRVSEALMAKLVPEDREGVERRATKSSAAYVRYLRGRSLMTDRTENGIKEAVRLFEEAIAEDPEYADAYTGLADAYYLLNSYKYIPRELAERKGKEALTMALQLDEGSAEAHNTMAGYLETDFKFSEAESEFRRAILINPNYALAHHWYSICLLEMGRRDEAVEQTKLAQELDPLSPALALNLSYEFALSGKETEAQEQYRKLVEIDTGKQFTDWSLALMAHGKGDYLTAATHLEDLVKRRPSQYDYLSFLGYCYGKIGKTDQANEILEVLKRLPDDARDKAFNLGLVYWGLGQFDEMYRQFEISVYDRSMLYRVLRYHSDKDLVKSDPRYHSLFAKAGLEPS